MNPKGVVIRPSPYTVKETIDRLVTFLEQHHVTWLAFNEVVYLGERYSLPHSLTAPADLDPLIARII
jgi:hypothetical protein